VKNTWLIPWKEKLVRFWVDQHLHFGCVVTSPIEGCHSTLKKYLQFSNQDLATVFNKLIHFWVAQQQGILDSVARQRLRPKHNTNIPLLAAVVGKVHDYALQKILKEHTKLPARNQPPSTPCICTIQGSIGLPCLHIIWERKQGGGTIRIEDIHPHWHYDRPSTLDTEAQLAMVVLNPLVIRGKGRPKGALGGQDRTAKSSTKRLPSAFELPPSTAPAALGRPQSPLEQFFVVQSGLSSTVIGMSRFGSGHVDTYEPGTARERQYMSGLSSVYKDDCIEDIAKLADKAMENETQDCIEVEVLSD
jgi:hypothetical protein